MSLLERIRGLISKGVICAELVVHSADEVHFEAIIVSPEFEGLAMLRRHQKVYVALGDLMHNEVHAFSMRTLTPAEYEAEQAR